MKISSSKYPVNKKEVKQFTFPKGALDAFIDNAFVGNLPRKIYIVCVNNEAYHGKLEKDPFNFEHFNINYITCYFNSVQFPNKAFKPDFEKKKYAREYLGLFKAADQTCENTNPISYDQYMHGKTVFGFNFSPDLSNGCVASGYSNLIMRGTIRFEIHFAKALPDTINILAFAEYDTIVQVRR